MRSNWATSIIELRPNQPTSHRPAHSPLPASGPFEYVVLELARELLPPARLVETCQWQRTSSSAEPDAIGVPECRPLVMCCSPAFDRTEVNPCPSSILPSPRHVTRIPQGFADGVHGACPGIAIPRDAVSRSSATLRSDSIPTPASAQALFSPLDLSLLLTYGPDLCHLRRVTSNKRSWFVHSLSI